MITWPFPSYLSYNLQIYSFGKSFSLNLEMVKSALILASFLVSLYICTYVKNLQVYLETKNKEIIIENIQKLFSQH